MEILNKYITKKTYYCIFKKVNSDSSLYYIRVLVDGVNKIVWFTGRENSLGLISAIGGSLSEEKVNELENEFIEFNKTTL